MTVTQEVLSAISCFASEHPSEVGGLLGSSDGSITDNVFLDAGTADSRVRYTPDTAAVNRVLRQWAVVGILFKGMFHSHFYGVSDLSGEDRDYIKKIALSVSRESYPLFFPVFVLPDKAFFAYQLSDRVSDLQKIENIKICKKESEPNEKHRNEMHQAPRGDFRH